MKSALDSSILVSAVYSEDPDHHACRQVLLASRCSVIVHAFTETFSTLTGGRLGLRVPASQAAELLRQQVFPRLRPVSLDPEELLLAFEEAESRGISGGAIYDYLHLAAARKAGAKKFFTLNLNDFLSFHRPCDPEILSP